MPHAPLHHIASGKDLLRLPNTSLIELSAFYLPALTFGTAVERISDESQIWLCWLFVLHNMWFREPVGATKLEADGASRVPVSPPELTFSLRFRLQGRLLDEVIRAFSAFKFR